MNPRSSIYTIEREIPPDSLLRRFLSDGETGWGVARNLKKPLNHLELLKKKEFIAEQLNLHNLKSDPETFARNYSIVQAFHRGEAGLADTLGRLVTPLGRTEVEKLLSDYTESSHLEFHPTDLCNLRCSGCTYKSDDTSSLPDRESFDFDTVQKLALFKPKSMVVIGGGEPTLYRNSGRNFCELLCELRRVLPALRLGLITNGTYKPACDEQLGFFSWVRVSLDAASESSFKLLRSGDAFSAVVENLLSYLRLEIPFVGISFTYSTLNIHEYADVLEYLYHRVQKDCPERLPHFNVQYRPFIDSDNLYEDPERKGAPPDRYLSDTDIEKAAGALLKLVDRHPDMEAFIKNQTNATAVLAGNFYPLYPFSRCYYSQIFKLVRANGNIFPCFMRALGDDFVLGNLRNSTLAEIGLNSLFVSTSHGQGCHTWTCRSSHINRTLQMGLTGELSPSMSPDVLQDPMF